MRTRKKGYRFERGWRISGKWEVGRQKWNEQEARLDFRLPTSDFRLPTSHFP